MKYSLKTGRLKFEAADYVITKKRAQKTRSRLKLPMLRIERPVSDEKTIDSLNKQLSRHIITFDTKKQLSSIARILTGRELFAKFKRTMVQATAVFMMLILVYGSVASMNLTFAKQVIANGTPVGIVTDVDAFEQKVNKMEEELEVLSEGDFTEQADIVYITRICHQSDITPDEEIMQNMMATYEETSPAYALYVDGVLVCATKERQDLTTVLDNYKKEFYVEGAAVGFYQNVEIKEEYVPVAYLCSSESVYEAITKTEEEQIEYTVQENDTMWDIANRNNISVDDIMALNPDMTDLIKPGDILILNETEPLLQVKASYTETVEMPIPYEVETVYDDSVRKGLKTVVIQGVDGEKMVTQEVVLVNGKQAEIIVKDEVVLKEPIKGKIKEGTKIISGMGTGSFMRPTYGTITARYGSGGSRWSSGRHTGLDFAASTGTSIVASDSGRVTFAGWKGSYGYTVIIDHGNGYETYYAHCSKLHVSVGEKVNRGDLIARVGSTGNSTGSHCHFEIRYNGVTKNPENYLR